MATRGGTWSSHGGTTVSAVPRQTPDELVAATRSGDRSALARLLSLVERGGDAGRAVGRALHGQRGDAYTVGITGAPGAGKSTLTSALVDLLRRRDERVAVLAIDPSSPFSGGAILGDRVRMGDHALDDGVFIRSMATRGHLGGLAVAAPEAVRVLTAAGLPVGAARDRGGRPGRGRGRRAGRHDAGRASTPAGATPCRPTRPA